MAPAAITPEQAACAAKRHKPYVRASRTVSVGPFATARVRYCTGCGMEFGKHAGAKS